MQKCKSASCENETKPNRIYCSASCRTRTTNLLYKNYGKSANIVISTNREKFEIEEKRCKYCSKLLKYEQRHNEFCDHSCSAKLGNTRRKGEKRIFSKQAKENIRVANRLRCGKKIPLSKQRHYNGDLRSERKQIECLHCKKSTFNKLYCSNKCRSSFTRKDDIAAYRRQCVFTFGLSKYPDKFEFSLIEKHGWYKPSNRGNNIGGVSRDHMFSVKEGFVLNVDPEIMKHPANCKLMIHSENISKNDKSTITLDELLERIKQWDADN